MNSFVKQQCTDCVLGSSDSRFVSMVLSIIFIESMLLLIRSPNPLPPSTNTQNYLYLHAIMVIKSVCYTPAKGGYIYIRELGHGAQGTAILVRSMTDSELYVLKKSYSELEAGEQTPSPEVEFYRPHPRVPKLVYHEAFVDQDLIHLPVPKKINTLISSYCNLVDLNQLQTKCFDKSGKVDEVLIWRCFSQMLEVIEFLHFQCQPKIHHGDIRSANIFAHFPADKKLPDFFLGDFGVAEYIPEVFDKIAGSGYVVIEDYFITEEYFRLKRVFSGLLNDTEHPAQRERLVRVYSEQLLLCYDALEWFIGDDFNMEDYQAELQELRIVVDTEAKVWEKRSTVDLSYLRPGDELDNAFFFYDSQEELLDAIIQPPGPWQAARVDTETWELLSIDPVVHHKARLWALDKGRTWD